MEIDLVAALETGIHTAIVATLTMVPVCAVAGLTWWVVARLTCTG